MGERWLVKVQRYGGGESVIRQYSDKSLAEDQAAAWNENYQTDAAYVEQWEAHKSDWPSREDIQAIACKLRNT